MNLHVNYETELDKLNMIHYVDLAFLNLKEEIVFPKKKEKVMYEPKNFETSSELCKQHHFYVPSEIEFRTEVVSSIQKDCSFEIPFEYIERYVEEKYYFPTQTELNNYYG